MADEKKLKLFHPVFGVVEKSETVANRIMSIREVDRGGWEWYTEPDEKALNQEAKNQSEDDPDSSANSSKAKGKNQGDRASTEGKKTRRKNSSS